ncbi:DUF922 domain-containing protein [Rhodanobacter sp. A1T4]|jgi:predicted secreted Zn-dependent protease|uniref:DUF922 domain-containing Zn-dependent protease n=1 Tax=Rhodanobacter sp. A1T4 TaxID=2723087 RepID=UPI00160B0393|nr:DUF922 domain-containing protein [Rhodanobacter sp. A1T4]MBB6247897.1 putative secreted Zn-dependent protease [Rhodanobacter sp. A1T4]
MQFPINRAALSVVRRARAKLANTLCFVTYVMLVLGLVASAEATPVDAPPTENPDGYVLNEHVNYYLVTGDDGSALRRSLDSQGPIGVDGKRYDGYTRWDVHWDYVTESDASSTCAVVSSNIVLNVEITLPQWQPAIDVPDSLQRRWLVYLKALRGHEDGHLENAEMAAMAIDHLLQTIGPQSDCQILDEKLQTLGQQILQHFRDNDVEYDQRTEHGRTQGAVFP